MSICIVFICSGLFYACKKDPASEIFGFDGRPLELRTGQSQVGFTLDTYVTRTYAIDNQLTIDTLELINQNPSHETQEYKMILDSEGGLVALDVTYMNGAANVNNIPSDPQSNERMNRMLMSGGTANAYDAQGTVLFSLPIDMASSQNQILAQNGLPTNLNQSNYQTQINALQQSGAVILLDNEQNLLFKKDIHDIGTTYFVYDKINHILLNAETVDLNGQLKTSIAYMYSIEGKKAIPIGSQTKEMSKAHKDGRDIITTTNRVISNYSNEIN